MQFTEPLKRGRLIRRYKRFLADIVFDEDEREETVHVPNPGAMLGLAEPGIGVWVSRGASKTRKLPHTLEIVEADGGLVGVNTLNPNRLVAEALAEGRLREVAGYARVRREVRYGQASRIDFLLEGDDRPPLWLEIKNCHFRREPGLAEFPDCVAARSAKHLRELEHMAAQGDRAAVLFVIQRTDCEAFDTAGDIDPVFAAALKHARANGVEVLAYRCAMSPDEIRIAERIPWRGLSSG